MKNRTPNLKLIKGGKKEFDFNKLRILLAVFYFIAIIILVCEAR